MRPTKSIILIIICCGFAIAGCHTPTSHANTEQAIKKVIKDFDLSNTSYLITANGETVTTHYAAGDQHMEASIYQAIIDNFAAPVILNSLMKNKIVKEDSALKKMFPAIRNDYLRIRDLVFVPAGHDEPIQFRQDTITKMIQSIIQTTAPHGSTGELDKFMPAKNGDKGQQKNIHALFTSLSEISAFFDKDNIAYAPVNDSIIPNLAPTWFSKNLVSFFGWNLLKFQKKSILWNCFISGNNTILLLKFIDRNVFAAVAYDSRNVPSPFSYNSNDLLQSPVALAMIRHILFPETAKNIDYQQPWDSIAANIQPWEHTPYRILYRKDLIAHARFYEQSGNAAQAAILYKGYATLANDSLLAAYINQPLITGTGYISDNLNAIIPFNIDSSGEVQIFAGGQVLTTNDYNYSPYQYDNIQIFLNESLTYTPATKAATQVFHFNYRFNKIAGVRDDRLPDSWIKNTAIRYAFSDPSDTSYLLEIAIPWQEIHGGKPPGRRYIAANIFIGDSDWQENKRESVLSWATRPGQNWEDPATFGKISFTNQSTHNSQISIRCPKSPQPPDIDGLIDDVWSEAPYSDIIQPYVNTVSPADNAGRFKTLYDDKYLYLLFNIVDDCKNKTGILTKDKCWIEDAANRQLIWKLSADTSRYMPSYSRSQRVYLKAGKYVLRYLSDKGHSFEGWYGTAPQNDIYGASIYKIRK